MDAGRLNHKLRLMRDLGPTLDSRGQIVPSTTDLATVWASVEPFQGEEAFLEQQLDTTVTHRVKIRWSTEVSGVRVEDFFLFSDDTTRRLDIVGVTVADDKDFGFDMICGEKISVDPLSS